MLALIGEKCGYYEVRDARMINDAPISTSASRKGIVVQTINDDNYRKIAESRHFE